MIVSISIWKKILIWILAFIIVLLLFSYFDKKESKVSKFFSVIFAFLVLGVLLIPIFWLVNEGYFQLKNAISSHFSEFVSLIALGVSIVSLLLTNMIFDKKVLMVKGGNSKGEYIEIVNNSNKNIEIQKFFVDENELIANEEKQNIITPPITIDDITYMMFNRNGNVKVCKGSGVKIQYQRNKSKKDYRVLRFQIVVEYRTLGMKRKKTIETDLSPFI